MDFFTKNKLLFWCVMVLMLLNVLTLASVWLHRPPVPFGGMHQGRISGLEIMQKQLGLSKEQSRQIERIRNEHFARTDPILDEMRKIRLDVLDEVFASEPNRAKTNEYIEELGKKQIQFETKLYNHFAELKQACTPGQRGDLKRMLVRVIENPPPRETKDQAGGPAGNPDQMPSR
jgi:Spy/CpxP family protein refolding chaperone